MIWNLLKLRPKSRDNTKRSEEVSDIIDRMPTAFSNWVALAIIIFSILLVLFGWLIRYPDVVTGQIKINSNTTSVKLPANTSGKIKIFGFEAQDVVKEGDYLAIIENPANTSDVQFLASLVRKFDPNNTALHTRFIKIFPEKVSLGELNLKYYTFLSALKNMANYYKDNVYEQQRTNLEGEIKWKIKILGETEGALAISNDNLDITEKWLEKYKSINKNTVAATEFEIDERKTAYLAAKRSDQDLIKEIASIQLQIAEIKNRLSLLTVEKNEKERQIQLDLQASYHDLNDQITHWEQTYVLKAPFNGRVEFLKFWAEGQFVHAGEDVFSIVPKENKILGQVLLPAIGAGKVKIGSNVSIKLDDYPYAEYGAVKGVVKSISLITNEYKTTQSNINTYLVTVDMPNGLLTNYGDKLGFKYEIGGQADIIVKDRRLIERLFDNIKFNTK
ncbi:HlyD family secretion protein [Arcticibacter tournemirensis]|uniref:HlyD family efflux transporter periplasmic adaptor subunit n=1 Tax=Arcticibacter tournemirensis TaxID=699437 RepID=A0A5M9H9G1_9SPHI|nr:HlyD family efflux transporter periplasmic adaptor subunit [Arcticibacter tournemirensis]KAA8483553.1 HlyD family efflux transporter periplasmic adaptor subunit [Arcticibacter tournemirensis]TQM51498.1 HlyD family secretion protein [Arcticibacter tournemirensis]